MYKSKSLWRSHLQYRAKFGITSRPLWSNLSRALTDYNWKEVLEIGTVDDAVELFEGVLMELMRVHIPDS